MASVYKRGDNWSLRFYDLQQQRRTISLNTKSKRKALKYKLGVEDLLAVRKNGGALEPETLAWLSSLKPAMTDKLIRHGLVAASEPDKPDELALGSFLTAYLARRTDVKDSTKINWRHTNRNLLTFFDADKLITEFTVGDAKDFERFLKSDARENGYAEKDANEGLSGDTVRKRISNAKQFFQDAVDRELIPKNPFMGLKSATVGNADRFFFVTRAMAGKVLDACPPHSEWPLIFALCRYGGLRCPSELLKLRLSDVDWGRNRFLVHAPKTEHHEGKATRWVPIFAEIRPYLDAVWHSAKPGQEYFVTRGRDKSEAYFRTMLMKIIKRAGLDVWPKLFQNLRSTRQTELEETYPSHVVCAWLGNSVQVARKHYLQVTDEHFEKAARGEGRERAPKSAPIDAGAPESAPAMHCQDSPNSRHQERKPAICGHVSPQDDGLMGVTGFEPVTSAM